MTKIILPSHVNYIAAFLTFRCNLGCPYCINKYGDLKYGSELSTEQWEEALSRIETREDLPITLCGGEPTVRRDFYDIVNILFQKRKKIDLLTNGKFNLTVFMNNITPYILKRKAPYASIRFSHHKGINEEYIMDKVGILQSNGYSVGVWGLDNNDNSAMERWCKDNGVDFRVKEFLSKDHGTYKYPEGLSGKKRTVLCKPSELIIGPSGHIYRCHSDLYSGRNPLGHILEGDFKFPGYLPCDHFGECNPCDLKMKFNRFQQTGHCSVEIKEVSGVDHNTAEPQRTERAQDVERNESPVPSKPNRIHTNGKAILS